MLLLASLCITTTLARPNPLPAEEDTIISSREAAAAEASAEAAYLSESLAFASAVSHFFATAEPTAKAAASSELAAANSEQAAEISYFASLTAAYASESAAHQSSVSHFFATAEPTAKVALSSELAAESSNYAAITIGNFSDTYAAATAAYASDDAAYRSAVTRFFATAEPTAKARLSSELAAETSFYADLTQSLSPSEAAAVSEELRQWNSEAAVYATYTGTSDLFGYGYTDDGTAATKASSTPAAQIPAVNISQAAVKTTPAIATAAPTSTADWPRLGLDPNNKPASYAIQCLSTGKELNSTRLSGTSYNFRDCTPAFTDVCNSLHEADNLSSSNTNTDKWVWGYGDSSKCIAAFWLPKSAAGVGKVPTVQECERLVYGRMLEACFTDGGLNNAYNMGRVNIVHGVLNETSGESGEGSYQGEQVDAGSPSYQVGFFG